MQHPSPGRDQPAQYTPPSSPCTTHYASPTAQHDSQPVSSACLDPCRSESRVLRRFDEPTRSAFHNKVRLFSRLAAARVPCIPTTLFTVHDTQAALSAGPPNAVWFYKKAKESRGRGVFPFTSLDQLPPEELAAAEAAEAASAAVASDASATPPASLTTPASTPGSVPASGGGGGIFQKEVSNMLLWEGGRKFDLRVLVVLGPGRRAWLHRTLYVRVATQPLAPPGADPAERLSRGSQCTNISQGGVVLALQGPEPGVPLSDVYDKVLDGVCTATRSVISAMYDALPAEGAIHYFGGWGPGVRQGVVRVVCGA